MDGLSPSRTERLTAEQQPLVYKLRHPYSVRQNLRLTMLDAATRIEEQAAEIARLRVELARKAS